MNNFSILQDRRSPAEAGQDWKKIRQHRIEAENKTQEKIQQVIDKQLEKIHDEIKKTMEFAMNNLNNEAAILQKFKELGTIVFNSTMIVLQNTTEITLEQLREQYHLSAQDIKSIKIVKSMLCYEGSPEAMKQNIENNYQSYALSISREKDTQRDERGTRKKTPANRDGRLPRRTQGLQQSLLGYALTIMDTEAMYLNNHLLMNVAQRYAQYGECVSGEYCTSYDDLGNCTQYCDGVHSLATLYSRKQPPFHPNCHCFYVFYTINELNDSNKEEKEE